MKMIIKTIAFSLIAVLLSSTAFAEKYKGTGTVQKSAGHTMRTGAAGCLPGKSSTDLSLNNVRARINTGGDMWWDLQGIAKYEIPKGSTKTSMFSASLWMGGLDVNGQLKGAFQRFRTNGNDYWPGPLTKDGTAAITSQTCAAFDKHFAITKAQVLTFTIERLKPDYKEPEVIKNWPAHGNAADNQSYYLAPFVDLGDDGNYDYEEGDYPYYDFDNSLCRTSTPTMDEELHHDVKGSVLSDQVLKGDQTLWWVFNDNGNIHSESLGNSIGVEIRAQAFAFSTNDEINNMTFYTYEIINRSTYRLTETYFSQWVDTDLGYAFDDKVGCDVKRGLGYCYNGDETDGLGKQDHYGNQPPAIGVDFFQGPYMDKDEMDNPKFRDSSGIISNCDVSINGVNFGDGIKDNERFGMRRFVYHNNDGTVIGDPSLATEYYNFLKGIWKDATKMRYGGNGHSSGGGVGPDCDFMFPGDTDPCNWGTGGTVPPSSMVPWIDNTAKDKRFMQSAGPFTLEPGAVNYITVGIPWARATSGGAFASVKLLQTVDDKCQALFDNCFKVLDGPDAPVLTIQELDRELILFLSNIKASNNYGEKYKEEDVTISALGYTKDSSSYKFQGYQIYQLANSEVSVAEIYDLDKSRLVAQCDIKDGITNLVNYNFSDKMNGSIPQLMVEAEDKGIQHSFRITQDKFAFGDTRLVNHKKYYYIALAYSYNNFLQYSQDPGIIGGLYGQKKPYLAGRKAALGPITVSTAIPHLITTEGGGTQLNSMYGNSPKITRLDGQGNDGNILELTKESISKILELNTFDTPEYEAGFGPVNVKVIDPLSVKPGTYKLQFDTLNLRKNYKVSGKSVDNANHADSTKQADTASWFTGTWMLINLNTNDTFHSDMYIHESNEQLFLNLGISIQMSSIYNTGSPQVGKIGTDAVLATLSTKGGMLTSEIEYADSSRMWLNGVPDFDASSPELNWIRSGTFEDKVDFPYDLSDYDVVPDGKPSKWVDDAENYERIVGGTWAPYRLVSKFTDGPAGNGSQNKCDLSQLQSVNIVFTSDKSKWTRCPVIETGDDATASEGSRKKLNLRSGFSVNRDGVYATSGSGLSLNVNDPNYIGETGMGWFPGYAINVETGERLNMMYGESSWLQGENGRDMLFNPTSNYYTNIGEVLFGGKHFVYVFTTSKNGMPAYDGGKHAYEILSNNNSFIPTVPAFQNLHKDIMYCGIPLASTLSPWLSNDVTIKIRIAKPYRENRYTDGNIGGFPNQNQIKNLPMYQFSLDAFAAKRGVNDIAKEALDIINIVPNPYYSYSSYETNQLDNRVRITNLPENCTISIFSTNGTLVRYLSKDNNLSYMDWDLKNQANIPIASGIYYFHINVPGVGEKVLKWFGVLRPVDLNAY